LPAGITADYVGLKCLTAVFGFGMDFTSSRNRRTSTR
jgi:hypoxanthine-guanine phosphoribosyltransferase